MRRDFEQVEWDNRAKAECRRLVRAAMAEDLGTGIDLTTVALVPEGAIGGAAVVARRAGTIAGIAAGRLALAMYDRSAELAPCVAEGDRVEAGQTIAELRGSARNLLTAERVVLNLMGRLSGIATLTRAYVDAVRGTKARVYDTRKTTPCWRRLEKFAVRQGGGWNHRMGLSEAVLIKDNHLAWGRDPLATRTYTPAEAVRIAREFLAKSADGSEPPIVEVEVDTIAQLRDVLVERPEIVLLDNMSCADLAQAVRIRDALAPAVELEASGGVTLDTIAAIARTGVERISAGALTHSAVALDLGLDWRL